ncbi:ATP-binding cassette domain-containing protein [Microtetraspora malaysiensis]|uniref:ATP-binding cassette domain-containing protein n=1 Tax=Microtetraspora malaysiensis TaxID=161358 RepID=UPI000830EAF5|nr:ABC transporter ATP-binding protein [Microtetraspora malaysiensis]
MIWRSVTREPRRLARLAGWSLAEALPSLLIGHAIARAIEDGFAAARPVAGLAWLALLGGAWLVAAVGARQSVLAVAAIAEPFRDELLARVVGGAVRHAVTPPWRPGAESVARSTLQVELARDAFAAVITAVRSFAFTVVSVVVGMATLLPAMLPLVLPPFAAGLAVFLLSLPAMARRQRAFLVADERLAESVTAMAGGLRDIVSCGAEGRVAADIGQAIAAQAVAARRVARVTAVRTLSLGVAGWLPVLLVLAYGPGLGASAGAVVGTLAYVVQSLAPALGGLVEGLGVSGVRLAASVARIRETTPLPGPGARRAGTGRGRAVTPREPRPGPRRTRTVRPRDARVELRGVTFAYGPEAEPVVSGLDLVLPEGCRLAVVGPSGLGKSTLAALVTGLLEPSSGEVRIGGVPARDVDPAARVLIPQEAYVFQGTLRENLTYLASAAPDAVRRAIDEVGMAELAHRLGGLSAEVNPAALSAGERQLIALTRAYLSPARLVILDEATCHLDPAAEARAEAAFARRGGTLVVVAHRLTSALRARHVLLMDGTRVRLGTHDELVAVSPLYRDLLGQWTPDVRQVS